LNVLTEQIPSRLEVLRDPSGRGELFRFRGTALVQGGLSRNGRYYPPEVVAAAMAQARTAPLTIYARHREAVEGSGLPVGRVDRLYLDGPALKYEARLAPTRLGHDLRALIEGGFLAGASIRACPYASHPVRLGDRDVEWVDSLTLRGIDFTDEPGVPEAAGFEILEEALVAGHRCRGGSPGSAHQTLEEKRMDLQSLDLAALRAQRPDLLAAVRAEAAAALEEVRRLLGVADADAVCQVVRELVRLRARQEIADLVDAELASDPSRAAIRARLVEECGSLAEARQRLERERAYAAELRRGLLAAGNLHPPDARGQGLVENAEDAVLDPERAHIRRLAGL